MENPPRGERSASTSMISEDDDEPGGVTPQPTGKVSSDPMAAIAVIPLSYTNPEGIGRLVALVAAKENELRALQTTHDEYVKSSCEYERELEGELERCERRATSLEGHTQSLEDAKATLAQTLSHTQHELAMARKREDALANQVDDMKWRIQRLEQTNDELETATRVAQATIDELQHRVETLTEANVFLVQEKEDALNATPHKTSELRDEPPKELTENCAHATRRESVGGNASRTGSTRRSARLPEVVESCLHITCCHEQCRQQHPAAIAKAALVEVATPAAAVASIHEKTRPTPRKSFLMRLRLWASA